MSPGVLALLRWYRRHGLTYRQIEESTGVPASSAYYYLTGKRR